jgi:hypothetical protein
MKFSQKGVLFAGMTFFALLLVLVSAGCSQSEAGEDAGSTPSPGVTSSALPSQRPDDAGNSSDLDEIVARYRAAHPPDNSSTASAPGPCEEYAKTGEFVEVVGGLLDLVREDPAASRLLSDGGEIAGVVVACPPTAATKPVGPGCYPAVRIRYGEMTIDFLVNIDCMCIEKKSVEVPSGYLSRTADNITYIIHNNDVVLAL